MRSRRRVRQRLLAALLLSVIAVLAAGAPGLVADAGALSESQRLLRLAQLNTAAIALSHALADERDGMTAYVAAGRTGATGHGLGQDERARVDRQVADVSRAAAALDTNGAPGLATATAALRSALASLSHIRRTTLSGPGSAKAAFDAYTPVIDSTDAISGALARTVPARAADPETAAGPALARAVTDASAEHGLLVAALTAGGSSSALVGGAQQARLREKAALSDFAATATTDAQTRYAQTVTGTDVTDAERYLSRLTEKSHLSASDNLLKTTDVDTALAARVDRMRAVQASLAATGATRLASLRGRDVTALEVRGGLVLLCALFAFGTGVAIARSVTRPLAGLQRYAENIAQGDDPTRAVPLGSRDEIAAIALAVQRLGQETTRLHGETAGQERERTRLLAVREKTAVQRDEAAAQRNLAAAEWDDLRRQHTDLLAEKETLTARIDALQGVVHTTFVHLSLRTLALVERQLALIESLENREQDPDQLETLFRLDHLATRMRRNSESLLVLAGSETAGNGTQARPVPLLDVVRAAISEIERYERVRVSALPRAALAGFAADDVSHLIAELMENATAFSPPQADVEVSGRLLENGEVMLSVEDTGIGIPGERLAELNRLLATPHPAESAAAAGLGLYVVARLAGRHGIRIQLRAQQQGGVAAVVEVPRSIIAGLAHGGVSAGQPDAADRPHRKHPPVPPAVPGAHARARGEAPAAQVVAAVVSALEEHDRSPHVEEAAPHSRPRHARPAGGAGHPAVPADPPAAPSVVPAPAEAPPPARPAVPEGPTPQADVTRQSLPKRMPRTSGLSGEPAVRPPSGPVDAEELRSRLGGFAQGLREGRRDAETEAAARGRLPSAARPADPSPVRGAEDRAAGGQPPHGVDGRPGSAAGQRSDQELSEEARG